MPQPNLLFVFADQMRRFDMGCAGNPQVRTPNMDRLASEGLMATQAIANCPVCTPSRATMLTGRYPLAHRAVANDLPLPTDVPGIGTLARQAGYRTGYIGKWHLDGVPRDRFTPPGPRRHGFDYWAVWNCSHQYFDARYYRDTPDPIPIDGYEPVAQTELALQFLAQRDDRPFCLFVSWGPPHDPYDQVPAKYQSLYDPERLTLRGNVRDLASTTNDRARAFGPARCVAYYYAAITALDDQLGRLLAGLDELGLAQDTIVVFTSDHGDMLFSQGWLKKQHPFEESVGIPFLLRWPAHVPAGLTTGALLDTASFAPSLLTLMQLTPDGGMQGDDLSAVMLGEANAGPSAVPIMDVVAVDESVAQGLREWRGVRTTTHTYARWLDGEPWVMFDNATDPLQMHNLIDDKASQSLRKQLAARTDAWMDRLGDPGHAWDRVIRELGLTDVWNARVTELPWGRRPEPLEP